MANPNPNAARARLGKKAARRPKPGTVKQLTAVLWNAITKLEAAIEPPVVNGYLDDHEAQKNFAVQIGELTKLTHALSQAGGVYLKAIEVGELEGRVQELEKQAEMQK